MAPVPPGQPGVRAPRRPRAARAVGLLLLALTALGALDLASRSGVEGPGAISEALRVGVAAVGLFAVCGFGLTRLVLPDALRRHELLWVLPIGAVSCALALSVLGFAYVPLPVGLVAVAVAGLVVGTWSLRRRPLAQAALLPPPGHRARRLGWPAWLALLLCLVALIPMFRAGFATVIGEGSDAHLAAGTAQFLKAGHHPLSVAVEEPVDQVPLVWRSKQPIYYAFAAVAQLSGLETWQALSTLSAVLLGLAALGFFVLVREGLGGGLLAGGLAMALVGLDRMVLHTVMHPYVNQTWGFAAMPWAIVLAIECARRPAWPSAALLVAFLAVLAFAYPLALPIPLLFAAIALWPYRRRAWRASRRLLWRGPRSLLWLVPLGLVFAVPVLGVVEKAVTAAEVVLPGSSLATWGGDLTGWFAEPEFLALRDWAALGLLGVPLALAAWFELRRVERRLAAGFAALLAFGLACAVWFRVRDGGFYFHFKALAFVGPVFVALAAAGLARVRADVSAGRWLRGGAVVVAVLWVGSALAAARDELSVTFDQLPRDLIALRDLPGDAPIRLDLDRNEQLWAAYLLADHPVCSQAPLLGTSYPHVTFARRSALILTDRGMRPPFDAARRLRPPSPRFGLYAARRGVPSDGGRCSRRMVQTVTRIR